MENWAIGIDLGGTKIEGALIRPDGSVHDRHRTFTKVHQGYEGVLEQLIDVVNEIIKKNTAIRPLSIGIGVPGQVKRDGGTVIYAPNLAWRNVNLQSDLQGKLNMHVTVCNDVRACAWGEWLHGSGKNCDNLVCVFAGTGIGGAIVSEGQMINGASNSAGEIGHMTIDLHGPVCHCGNRGCFEAFAGGWAIKRDAIESVQKSPETGKILLGLADGDLLAITAKLVFEAAAKGDALSKAISDKVDEALIAGFTSIVNVYNPKKLILGGGIVEGNPRLLPLIEKGIHKFALKAATTKLQVLPAMLHRDSGVVGAATFALHMLQKNVYYGTDHN